MKLLMEIDCSVMVDKTGKMDLRAIDAVLKTLVPEKQKGAFFYVFDFEGGRKLTVDVYVTPRIATHWLTVCNWRSPNSLEEWAYTSTETEKLVLAETFPVKYDHFKKHVGHLQRYRWVARE